MSSRDNRLHRSVGDRIRLAAGERGTDANRLRRALVFQRLLARLAPAGLILKGGYCLEVRLPGSARATKDVDVVGALALASDEPHLRDDLDELLDRNDLADGFGFRVGRARRLRDEDAGSQAWRIELMALLDGVDFERVALDLVGQVDEVMGATEPLVVPSPITLPGVGDVVVEAVDVYQHAAEKLHAYSRTYALERTSSRVKDLVDLVLLIEADLLGDASRLAQRLAVVHLERDKTSPPPALPRPPGDWARPYASMAAELGLTAMSTDAAYDIVAATYAAALTGRMDT